MVRIGDAEANLLRFARHRDEFELKWVNAVFLMNDNHTLPIEDAKRLSRELSELLASADIIGLRAFGPNPSDVHIRKISQAIDRRDLRGALGTIEALQYGDRAAKNGEYGPDKRVGSSWLVGASRRCSRQRAARRRDHRPARRSSRRCGQTFAERSCCRRRHIWQEILRNGETIWCPRPGFRERVRHSGR